MKNQIGLALFFGILIGCGASEIARHSTVTAQNEYGPKDFRQCVVYTLNQDRDAQDLVTEAKPIPAGWTPVGGAGTGALPGVVLCR